MANLCRSGELLILLAIVLLAIPASLLAQIPTVCANSQSLESLVCCPTSANGVCGEDAGRGSCENIILDQYSKDATNVRVNWPHYYTRICRCNRNFAGYDCSRCKFGYYGSQCSEKRIFPRKPVRELTDEEWDDFINILRLTRSRDSGYRVVLQETRPGNANLMMTNVSLYEYFTWLHHYASKDSVHLNRSLRLDYAHTGPAFFTWHRLFHLAFETEIQQMLKAMGREDYYKFRFPYWDSRLEIQRSYGMRSEDLFSYGRLGETRNVTNKPVVFGDLISNGWSTICLRQLGSICDPNSKAGPLTRCPFTESGLCNSSNPDWPKMAELNRAMEFDDLEVPPFDITSNCMRAYVDFPPVSSIEECRKDKYCQCFPDGGSQCVSRSPNSTLFPATSGIHAKVHFLLGLGSVDETFPFNLRGSFDDVAGSPNDPIFFSHHTFVDCVLQEYLKRHPNTEYPVHPQIRDGHRANDYIRTFFPLYTNQELFTKNTEKFGYYCSLSNVGTTHPEAPSPLETTFSISINGTNVEACVTTKEGQKFKIILRDANLKRQRGIVFGSSGCVTFVNVPPGLQRIRAISKAQGPGVFRSDWFDFTTD